MKPNGREALADLLADVETGRFPPADGGVTVMPQPNDRDAGVIGFTAHAVIFIDAAPDWVIAQLPPGDLSGPLSPDFLRALGDRSGRKAHTIDQLFLADALPGEPAVELTPEPRRADPHPRIERALGYRDDVRAWRADGGVMMLGRGVAGRWEVAIEVDPGRRGAGLGRALATAARHLVPGDRVPGDRVSGGRVSGDGRLWAQVSPGNVASVRAFLAAGFRPVGAEALLWAARKR
jgi:GNAT superfamily N-acetyltransferase